MVRIVKRTTTVENSSSRNRNKPVMEKEASASGKARFFGYL
jgi:hypothetical protein